MRDIRDVFKFKESSRVLFDGSSKYDFPLIKFANTIPLDLISFNYCLKHPGDKGLWVHFYIDDYQFERIWVRPANYVEVFKKFGGMVMPDFSVYKNLPKAVLIYQVYRARFLAAYYSSFGIRIIPNVTWWNKESLDITLEGFPERSVIAITTHGGLGKKKKEFLEMCDIVFKRLNPDKVLVVGTMPKEWIGDNRFKQFGNEYAQLVLIEKEKDKV